MEISNLTLMMIALVIGLVSFWTSIDLHNPILLLLSIPLIVCGFIGVIIGSKNGDETITLFKNETQYSQHCTCDECLLQEEIFQEHTKHLKECPICEDEFDDFKFDVRY